ncbi:unnamed protein product [Closterium sp. NIES-54]
MRRRSGSGDLGRLSTTCLRTSCPLVLLFASSWGSPLTRLGGSSTTPPLAVFCPPRTSRLTSPPPVDPLPPQGPAPSGVSQVDEVEPVEVTGDSGAAGGAEPGGAGPGGAATGGAEPGGAEPGGAVPGGTLLGGAEPGDAEPGGAEPGGAEPGGAELHGAPPGGTPGASSLREPLSPQELREWFARRRRRAAGAGGSSATEGDAVAGPGGARTVSTGADGPTGSTGAGAAEGVGTETTAGGPAGGTPGAAGGSGAAGGAAGEGAPAGGPGAVPTVSGVAARPRPYFVPLLEQVLGSPPSAGLPPSLACPQPVQSQLQVQPTSPLPAPSPYTGPTGGLAERREPASRPASPVRAARTSGRGLRQRPPPVPGTHRMSLRPSTAPLRAPLPSSPESSLPALTDPESDSLRAANPTVTRLLATVVTDPSFDSTAASALVTELVDFAARCRLDYAASLVAESESVCPPSVGGECALGTDVLEDRQEEFQCLAAASPHLVSVLLTPEGDPDALDIPTPRSYVEAIEGPYSSQWQAAMDAEMASWKSTGTYVDAVPPPGANIVSGIWIFRVKRPPGSPPVFKARYVARGFKFSTWLRQTQRYLTSQRQDGATLYAHASGALQAPPHLEPLSVVSPTTPQVQADYARLVLVRDVWDSRDAAAALALTELLLPTKAAAHFDLVETTKEVYDAISARYSTPSSASLSRILMPFVFPDLGSFSSVSDLATHLRSLVASSRGACTKAQLLVAPPPIWLTIHSGDLEDPGALAATAALPVGPLAPRGATPAHATTSASPDRAVPVSAAATTTLQHGVSAASMTSTVHAGVLRRPPRAGLAC